MENFYPMLLLVLEQEMKLDGKFKSEKNIVFLNFCCIDIETVTLIKKRVCQLVRWKYPTKDYNCRQICHQKLNDHRRNELRAEKMVLVQN